MSNISPTIWWIRRGIRLADNPTLAAALAASKIVIPLFVRDPGLEHSTFVGPRRLAFLHAALANLDQQLRELGSQLVIRSGRPAEILPAILAETGATTVFAEADYSPYARRRDGALAEMMPLKLIDGVAIRPVGQVLKKDGTPYTVFTPFSKAWKAMPLPSDRQLLPVPQSLGRINLASESLPAHDDTVNHYPATAQEAGRRLDRFTDEGIYDYGQKRDMVAETGTSSLSPYLRFGLVSARSAAVAALRAMARANAESDRESAETWLNELIWREFYINILHHFPDARLGSFRPVYDNIEWNNDTAEFSAWCAGQTGYPIVDAAMRQLNETGWMHNRARMIVASFLVKHLLINWQWGERYFMQQLLDGDPAANNGGWQWTAGTGTDAAPYFRIFNPISQGKKFDPAGRYIRRWVPELVQLPDKLLHEPWRMTPLEQISHSCKLGVDYPHPIVDHKFARERVLAAYKKARELGE